MRTNLPSFRRSAPFAQPHTQTEINILGKYVNPYSAATQQMIAGMKQMFMSKGSDAATATQQAYGAIWGMIQQQASMVSFVQAFRLLGFIFVLVVPLIFLMRKPKRAGAGVPVH